jgi:hypothetical protein
MAEERSEPTIEVDSDWKAEAAREKQKLIDAEKKATGGGGRTEPAFVELLNLLAMQAQLALGGYEGPDGRAMPPDLAAARAHVSILEALQRKTEGNLSDEEHRGLTDLLHNLRMHYVQLAQSMGAPGPGRPGGPAAAGGGLF